MGTGSSGAWAEDAALKYLEHRGLTLLTRNYRCKLGELDLVMDHDHMLVFVEVRLRNNVRYGDGRESITYAKQQKLTRAAGVFLVHHPSYRNHRCRFDVVSVTKRNYCARCEWIQNAFS